MVGCQSYFLRSMCCSKESPNKISRKRLSVMSYWKINKICLVILSWVTNLRNVLIVGTERWNPRSLSTSHSIFSTYGIRMISIMADQQWHFACVINNPSNFTCNEYLIFCICVISYETKFFNTRRTDLFIFSAEEGRSLNDSTDTCHWCQWQQKQ